MIDNRIVREGSKMIEGMRVEFKREYAETIRKTVVAFANTEGGTIYIGIDDDGSIVGVEDPDDVQKKVVSSCHDGIAPDVMQFLSCTRNLMEGKDVVVVEVQRGTSCPYYLQNKGIRPEGVYIRRGSASIPASQAEILHMIRVTGDAHYEEERSLVQELSFSTLAHVFAEHGLELGTAQLRTLGIRAADGEYTNLGRLLSEACAHTIKVAVFQGTTKTVFKKRKEFCGSLLTQASEVADYLDLLNGTRSEIHGLRRVDRREYPPEALREALINAIVHREYALSGSTLISLFDHAIEILSLGGLPEGLTYADMMAGASIQRNPHLANVFYRLEYIEAYGTGVRKIRECYRGTGVEPTFLATDNAFKVTLPNLAFLREQGVLQSEHSASDIVRESSPDTFGRNETESRAVRPGEQDVLSALAAGCTTRRALQEATGFSLTKTRNILSELIEQQRVRREGKGRNVRYALR